ncbi:MAG: hypothetical protein Q9214_003850, partial [Letrouitia sp. 1 TL-2023]
MSLDKATYQGPQPVDTPRRYHIDPSKHTGTFETVEDPSFYIPIGKYEGRHRYDPKFEWEPKEERRLIRK